MQILKTKDYEKFSRPFNRSINEKHVQTLSKTLIENPNAFESPCIRVDPKFRIIDGQHRYKATVQTGNYLYYTVDPTITTDRELRKAIVNANRNTKAFTGIGYIEVYKDVSDEHRFVYNLYQIISPLINFSSMMYLLETGKGGSGTKYRNLEDENLKIRNKEKIIDFFTEIVSLIESSKAPSKTKRMLVLRWYLSALYEIYFNPQPRFNFKIIKDRLNTHWDRLGCAGSKESAKKYLQAMCTAKSSVV